MLIKFKNFINESVEETDFEFIPMDIRKKHDPEFKNEKYKGKDINILYDYVSRRKYNYLHRELEEFDREYKPRPKTMGWEEIKRYFFDTNQEYLEHMKSLLMGKRVGYYNCGDKVQDNYYHVIPVVRRVEFNTYGMLVVSGGGGFFGENPGIGAHFGGAIDERMPLKILNPKIIVSELDPLGEEDWNS